MHLPAKANSLSVQTFMANKSLSDSDFFFFKQKYKKVKNKKTLYQSLSGVPIIPEMTVSIAKKYPVFILLLREDCKG